MIGYLTICLVICLIVRPLSQLLYHASTQLTAYPPCALSSTLPSHSSFSFFYSFAKSPFSTLYLVPFSIHLSIEDDGYGHGHGDDDASFTRMGSLSTSSYVSTSSPSSTLPQKEQASLPPPFYFSKSICRFCENGVHPLVNLPGGWLCAL